LKEKESALGTHASHF